MAPNDRARCIAGMAGDGFADDADPRAHHSTRDVSGRDAIHSSRVDREEDSSVYDNGEEDRHQEVDGEKDDGEKDVRQEIDREEIYGGGIYGEEDRRIRGSGEEAGCRLELVAAVERSQ